MRLPDRMELARRSRLNLVMPTWVLYDGEEVVDHIQAENPDVARDLFRRVGLTGTHMRRSDGR